MTDLALRLLRDGYRAIALDREERGGGATYASRLLGRRAVVLGGSSGAEVFYDETVVERRRAVPPPLAWLLFGRGAVHGLDDEVHRTRKRLFLPLLGARQVAECAAVAGVLLRGARERWSADVDLHDELVTAYGVAVLRWAGVDGPDERLRTLSREYARIVAGFGFDSPGTYARAWLARRRTDRWAEGVVREVRNGEASPPAGSALEAVASSDLSDRLAAVELGNVVRPTIAVSWLGVHAAAALAGLDPDERRRLAAGGDEEEVDLRWSFAQEVRRTTPFVPALAGRVRRPTTHTGEVLRRGDRVVLDVRGIDLDPVRWPDPHTFRSDRLLGEVPGPFEMVPQGGGALEGHRCPGESMALQLLVHTVPVLAGLDPALLRGPDLRRVPTLPTLSTVATVPTG